MADGSKDLNKNQGGLAESEFEAKDVTFADIEPGIQEEGSSQNMDFLLDIPLEITVELGNH